MYDLSRVCLYLSGAPASRVPSPMPRLLHRAFWCIALGLALSLLSGIALSWSRAAMLPDSLFGSLSSPWLERQHQPNLAITRGGVQLGMTISRSPILDRIDLRRPSRQDWQQWASETYSTPDAVESQLRQDRLKRDELMQSKVNYSTYLLQWADLGVPVQPEPPSWAAFPPADGDLVQVSTLAFGWPCRVIRIRGSIFADPIDTSGVKSTSTDGLGSYPSPLAGEPAWGIAWVPIWPGLALNTLIIAAPLSLLWTAAITTRARLRRRAHRCPACGYPTPGLTRCPECGTVAA